MKKCIPLVVLMLFTSHCPALKRKGSEKKYLYLECTENVFSAKSSSSPPDCNDVITCIDFCFWMYDRKTKKLNVYDLNLNEHVLLILSNNTFYDGEATQGGACRIQALESLPYKKNVGADEPIHGPVHEYSIGGIEPGGKMNLQYDSVNFTLKPGARKEFKEHFLRQYDAAACIYTIDRVISFKNHGFIDSRDIIDHKKQ
jgi:hypothetical protein